MKTTNLISPVVALVLASILATLCNDHITPRKGTNPTLPASISADDKLFVKDCLYSSLASQFPFYTCYKLSRPLLFSSDFSRRAASLRFAFYTEAAAQLSLQLKWSQCQALSTDGGALDQRCQLSLVDYRGLFPEDFDTIKYDLTKHFAANWTQQVVDIKDPVVEKISHCFLFHNEKERRTFSPQSVDCFPYARWTMAKVYQKYPELRELVTGHWLRHTLAILGHSWPEALNSSTWYHNEGIFNCLYPYPKSTGHATPDDTSAEDCARIVTPLATERALNFSSGFVNLEGLNRWGLRTVDFIRSLRVYDCLKYHRHEKVYWCEEVMKLAVATVRAYAEGRDYDRIIEFIWERVQREDYEQLEELMSAGNSALPFQVLRFQLVRLCDMYSHSADPKYRRPVDCEENGLYYPFLKF